ncbi:hypothetical protein Efla_003104 [Eimeria flavescens]
MLVQDASRGHIPLTAERADPTAALHVAASLMEAAQVEQHAEPSEDNVATSKPRSNNLHVVRGLTSRGRRGGGKRGRGRRDVVPRRKSSEEAHSKTGVHDDSITLLGSLRHEPDFCFNDTSASTKARGVSPADSSASKPYITDSCRSLHSLLSPQLAAATFAGGAALSTLWGHVVVNADCNRAVQATYRRTAEGLFLCQGASLELNNHKATKREQMFLDALSLRRDFLASPVPVRFWRSGDCKFVKQQQLQTGFCVVPPLMSASPSWRSPGRHEFESSDATDDVTDKEDFFCSSLEEDAANTAGEGKAVFETDALLNVGGSVLAVAVSQECGFTEALAHCRTNQAALDSTGVSGGNEGFVVLAVTVGPVLRCTARAACAISSTAASFEGSVPGTNVSHPGSTWASGEADDAQPSRQQRKAVGHVQLWTISSGSCSRPRLRMILQNQGGCCRNLHWIPNSQLLLPRCTDMQYAEDTSESQTLRECGCCDGGDCYRSRIGLLCGVNDSGDLLMWSVPLAPFLAEPQEGHSDSEKLHAHCDLEPLIQGERGARAVGKRGASAVFSQTKDEYTDCGIRCCALPPLWRFSSPSARFFCCAAAPGPRREQTAQQRRVMEPIVLVGGAGEGRLYVFSFSPTASPSQSLFSTLTDPATPPYSTLTRRTSDFSGLHCSLSVLTPGCLNSELRCCSFLPARQGVVADTAALQVVEGNCGCYRSREIHDLAWSAWSRYLVASAENALVINLRRQQVRQLPLRGLLETRGGKGNSSSVTDSGDRCCWGCASLGPLLFYAFSGGCLVQGDATTLKQQGHGGASYWQWCLADAKDQQTLSRMLQKHDGLLQAQRLAKQELKTLRAELLRFLKEQMVGLSTAESPQQTHQQCGLGIDLMQQRVDTLLALQQLEERCELLSRGLVICEGSALPAVSHHGGKRGCRSHTTTSSILALRKVAAICPWANDRFFSASARIVYGGAAGILHMKKVQVQKSGLEDGR